VAKQGLRLSKLQTEEFGCEWVGSQSMHIHKADIINSLGRMNLENNELWTTPSEWTDTIAVRLVSYFFTYLLVELFLLDLDRCPTWHWVESFRLELTGLDRTLAQFTHTWVSWHRNSWHRQTMLQSDQT